MRHLLTVPGVYSLVTWINMFTFLTTLCSFFLEIYCYLLFVYLFNQDSTDYEGWSGYHRTIIYWVRIASNHSQEISIDFETVTKRLRVTTLGTQCIRPEPSFSLSKLKTSFWKKALLSKCLLKSVFHFTATRIGSATAIPAHSASILPPRH